MTEEQKPEEQKPEEQKSTSENVAMGCLKWVIMAFAGLCMFTCGSCFLSVFNPKTLSCKDFCEKEFRKSFDNENAVMLCKYHCTLADGKCPPVPQDNGPTSPFSHPEWGGCALSWMTRYGQFEDHADHCSCGEKITWPW